MILSAHQAAYLPWLGYFHKMISSDVFVILDDVQFEKGSFTNRNRIKAAQGAQWLTVPVTQKFGTKIREMRVADRSWVKKHTKAIKQNYGKELELCDDGYLLTIALHSTYQIMQMLRLHDRYKVQIALSSCSKWEGERDAMLISLCKEYGADKFLFGAMGRDYINVSAWERAGIEPLFQEYETPEYLQRYGEFVPNLSAIDALFNVGPDKTWELICSGRIRSL